MADVKGLFLRGKEAADRGNYQYAIALFIDILRAKPEERNTRIALRGCEMELFRSPAGIKARAQGFLKGLGPFVMMHLHAANAEKLTVDCERYLINDPVNVYVLKKLSAAFVKLGYIDAAADTLEFARQRVPRNVNVLRTLGEVSYQQGEYDKAVKCYREILAVKPEDRHASQRAKDISAEAHLKRSNMEGSETYRDTLRDEDKADGLEREAHIIHSAAEATSWIDQLKQQVEANPDDAEVHAELGDALYNDERFDEAEPEFVAAFKLSKKYSMREKLGNTRIRRLEKAEETARLKADEGGGSPVDMAKAHATKDARIQFCIKEYTFRREQHPTDMRIAFQLGLYHLEHGGDDGLQHAIQQFQQALANASLKLRAQFMLGRCFAKNPKTLDMAMAQFQAAFEALENETGDMGKQILYEMASVDEQSGNQAEALTKYKKIFIVDAGFKDVAQKIQTLG